MALISFTYLSFRKKRKYSLVKDKSKDYNILTKLYFVFSFFTLNSNKFKINRFTSLLGFLAFFNSECKDCSSSSVLKNVSQIY